MKAGTIFDNILITDDEDFARQVAKETFEVSAAGEKEKKEAKDAVERTKKEEERKAREAEEAAAEAEVCVTSHCIVPHDSVFLDPHHSLYNITSHSPKSNVIPLSSQLYLHY